MIDNGYNGYLVNQTSSDIADKIIVESDLPSGGAYTTVGTYDHEELLTLLREKDDAYLTTGYRDGNTMAWFIEGVLQHDIYHLGQIAAVGLKV